MLARFLVLATLLAGLISGPVRQNSGEKELVETRSEEPTGQSMYTNSHALIVGINSYPNLPKQLQLQFAAADAQAVRDMLVNTYGFPADQTKLLLDKDATLAGIRRELSQLASSRTVKADDRILVYFSGHGQTVKLATGSEMGFLIPSDAKIDMSDPTDVGPYLETCLPMKQVWDYLSSSPAKHACIIADACFSGMMASRSLEMSAGTISAMLSRPARQVLTAGNRGQKTFERQDLGHGVFTYKLLEELKARSAEPGKVFSLMDLYTSLSTSVSNMTDGKQTPQFGNVETEGQVLFCSGSMLLANNNPSGTTSGGTGGNQQPQTTRAKLTIVGTPAGATLWIDGAKKGPTPYTMEVDLKTSGERTFKVRVEAKGYIPAETTVTLKPGDDVTLPVDLKQLPVTPPPVTTATVAIDSAPQGATIFVDGAQVGVTPYTLSVDLGSKTQRSLKIRIELEGYLPSESTSTVKRGDSISAPFTLKPVPVKQPPANHRKVKKLTLTQVSTLQGVVPVNSIMFSPDGNRLAVSGMDYSLTLFDAKGGSPRKVDAPKNSVVRITPDWTKVVITHLGILDGQLRAEITVKDAKTLQPVGSPMHVNLRSDTSVQDIYVGNSRLILCGSIGKEGTPTGFITIADLSTGQVVTHAGGFRIGQPASSTDGSTYAAFMEPVDLRAPGSILVIPADLTKAAKQIPTEGCNSSAGIDISSDGNLIALTCQRITTEGADIEGTRVYDSASGSQVQFLPKLRASAIIGGGAKLLGWRSQIGGPIVELLDAKTGDGLGEAPGGEVWLSRDEKFAAQASPEGIVTVYRLTQP